jgi:hypothetical protein
MTTLTIMLSFLESAITPAAFSATFFSPATCVTQHQFCLTIQAVTNLCGDVWMGKGKLYAHRMRTSCWRFAKGCQVTAHVSF